MFVQLGFTAIIGQGEQALLVIYIQLESIIYMYKPTRCPAQYACTAAGQWAYIKKLFGIDYPKLCINYILLK